MTMMDSIIILLVSLVGIVIYRKLELVNRSIESLKDDLKKNQSNDDDVASDLHRRLEFLQNARFASVRRKEISR